MSKKPEITESCGNVFKDIGFSDDEAARLTADSDARIRAEAIPARDAQVDLDAISNRRRQKILGGNWERHAVHELYEDFDALFAEVKRLRSVLSARSPETEEGTFACPVCGVKCIHAHGDADIFEWLDAQASRFGYRLAQKSWGIVSADERLSGDIDHCLHRLSQDDMADMERTPMGGFIRRTLAAALPLARAHEWALSARSPETTASASSTQGVPATAPDGVADRVVPNGEDSGRSSRAPETDLNCWWCHKPIGGELGPGVTDDEQTIRMHFKCAELIAASRASAPTEEQVICAAVQLDNGIVLRGHRHDDCFKTAMSYGYKERLSQAKQGFVTSRNRFVGRTEGAAIQKAAGIVSAWTGKFSDLLFSEDLYFNDHADAQIALAQPSPSSDAQKEKD